MKLGLLVMLPLAMWLFIDLLVPTALSATATTASIDYRQYFGPILGTIMNIIGGTLGLTPNAANDLWVWSPFIFGAIMAFLLPLFIFLGIRFSGRILGSGVDVSLGEETLHALYIFLFFLGLYLIAGIPASLYLQAIEFPFALLFFAGTTVAYLIGVFGLITRGS